MFTKVNPRQERFLWFVVDGMPATRAYAEVYGQDKSENTCAVSASQLLRNPKVIARRQELIAAKQARQPLTAEYLSSELMAIALEARALKQPAAAAGALMGVAKLQGLLVDQVRVDALVRKPSASPESPDEMSEEAWLAAYGQPALTIEHLSTTLAQPDADILTDADKDSTTEASPEPDGAQGSSV